MLIAPAALAAVSLLEASIDAIETSSRVSGWPEDIDTLAEHELWVSADLHAFAHRRPDWQEDYPGHLRPIYARDVTAVEGGESVPLVLRVYRHLTPDWYAWLMRDTSRARAEMEASSPAAWADRRARANALWLIACRWWPDQVQVLTRGSLISATYRAPTPDPDVAERYSATMAAGRQDPRTPLEGAGHAIPGSTTGPPGATQPEGEATNPLPEFAGKKL